MTFFAVCSAATKLHHLGLVPVELQRARAQRIRDEVALAREEQAVAEDRVGSFFCTCRARSRWQHGATTIASASRRIPAAIASSVAVSQACRLTRRSIGSSDA